MLDFTDSASNPIITGILATHPSHPYPLNQIIPK